MIFLVGMPGCLALRVLTLETDARFAVVDLVVRAAGMPKKLGAVEMVCV